MLIVCRYIIRCRSSCNVCCYWQVPIKDEVGTRKYHWKVKDPENIEVNISRYTKSLPTKVQNFLKCLYFWFDVCAVAKAWHSWNEKLLSESFKFLRTKFRRIQTPAYFERNRPFKKHEAVARLFDILYRHQRLRRLRTRFARNRNFDQTASFTRFWNRAQKFKSGNTSFPRIYFIFICSNSWRRKETVLRRIVLKIKSNHNHFVAGNGIRSSFDRLSI